MEEKASETGRSGFVFRIGSGETPQKLLRSNAFQFRTASLPPPTTLAGSYRPSGAINGSVGGSAAVFMPEQLQELQRQALIYKYIMASVPVPRELVFFEASRHLLPTTTRTMYPGVGAPPLNLRFSGGADPEPGRCRRTDGKKWRCSREVALGQKYCERHVHRGRPRSRKPVEVLKAKPIDYVAETGMPKFSSTNMGTSGGVRFLDANKDWNMINLSMGLKSEASRPIIASNFTDLNDECFPFTNSDLANLEKVIRREELPRSFIDAWSNENPIPQASDGYESQSLSGLKLSMYAGEEEEEEADYRTQMSLGFVTPFAGGPLAEVLQQTSATSSPRNWVGGGGGGGGGSSSISIIKSSVEAGLIDLMGFCGGRKAASLQGSPTGPAASSPSGVLTKSVLVSRSDSSESSSPTFSAAASSLQWAKHLM